MQSSSHVLLASCVCLSVELLVNITTNKREIASFGTWHLDSGLKQLALHSFSVWHGLSRFDPTIRP